MALSPADRDIITRFRERFEAHYRDDPRFLDIERADRADGSTLATRFRVADKLWIEMCLRPAIPQYRAGILTDDRWTSEDLEDAIESSGDTMNEYVELGFQEAGLDWPEPLVEHYRDQGKYFYFATALEPGSLHDLADDAFFDKARRMFEGYYEAFRTPIEKAMAKE